MTGASFHLAQVNVARLRADLGSPRMVGFVAAVEGMNLRAEASSGFVWRLRSSHGPVSTADDDPRLMVNLSVWEDYESLHDFVYRSLHGGYVRRRATWFETVARPATALWWVRAGAEPAKSEALLHLEHLRTYGPSPRVFTVRTRFGPDGRPDAGHGRSAG